MLWPKKNSYKEFENEKKFLRLENFPPPPITFLMVRPLVIGLVAVGARFEGWKGPCHQGKISLIKEKNDNNNVARHLEFRLCSHLRLVHMSTCLNHEVAIGKTS